MTTISSRSVSSYSIIIFKTELLTGTTCVLKPRYENCNKSPSLALISKFPSKSVAVPTLEPTITIFTPGIGSLSSVEETCPFTILVFCACVTKQKNIITKKGNLIL